MKNWLIIFAFLFTAQFASANAPEIGGEQYVESEHVISEPVAAIPVREGIVIEVKVGRNTDGTDRFNTYTFPYIPQFRETTAPHAIVASAEYERLSLDDKVIFHEKRIQALKRLAGLLEFSSIGLGMGSYVGSSIKWLTKLLPNGRRTSNAIDAVVDATLPEEIRNPRTYRDHRKKVVYEFLRAYDEQMAREATLVARENEFDVSIGLTVGGNGAIIGRYGAGISGGIGVTIAYKHDSNEALFEVFTQFETFKRAFTPMLSIGVIPLLEIEGRAQPSQGSLRNMRVDAVYPPVVPGMYTHGADSHSFAVSDGTFTGPFSTLSNAFSFETDRRRQVIFRTSVSFISKFIMTIKNIIGIGPRLVAMTFGGLKHHQREEAERTRAGFMCRRSFNDTE